MSWPGWSRYEIALDMCRIKASGRRYILASAELDFESTGWIATAFPAFKNTRRGQDLRTMTNGCHGFISFEKTANELEYCIV